MSSGGCGAGRRPRRVPISEGFTRLFRMLKPELTDEYFDERQSAIGGPPGEAR